MGLYDPQMRVGTSGTGAAMGRNYATNAATAGRVLTSQGDNLPPLWAQPAAAVAPVAQTLFVDAVNFSAAPTGALNAPFQTIQAAVNQAVANGWTQVEIFAAPATYADAIAIPLALEDVIISGWASPGTFLATILGGDITYTSLAAGWGNLHLRHVNVTAANITTANPAVEDLYVELDHCDCAAVVSAFNIDLALWHTNQTGNVTATGGLSVEFDGYSWARHVQATPVFTAGALYNRNFFDAGHDTYQTALTSLGVPVFPAVGSTVFETFALPLVTAQDHVSTIVTSPAAVDFIIGGHTCTAGNATIWLTNLSRVGGNFADDIELLIHHSGMQQE